VALKTSMLNGWAMSTIKLPLTTNKVYKLVGGWIIQPSSTKGGGYSATYVTIKEDIKIRAKKQGLKKPGKSKAAEMPENSYEQ
jgi:hypothetical protein